MEEKRSLEEDTNHDTNYPFDHAFWGTPPTKRAHMSYELSFEIKEIKNQGDH